MIQIFHLTSEFLEVSYVKSMRIQGWAKLLFAGLVNFGPAVDNTFCLNFPEKFSKLGNGNLARPCTCDKDIH